MRARGSLRNRLLIQAFALSRRATARRHTEHCTPSVPTTQSFGYRDFPLITYDVSTRFPRSTTSICKLFGMPRSQHGRLSRTTCYRFRRSFCAAQHESRKKARKRLTFAQHSRCRSLMIRELSARWYPMSYRGTERSRSIEASQNLRACAARITDLAELIAIEDPVNV